MSNILKSVVKYNPISGVFGNGEVEFFFRSGEFIVPLNVAKVRVRLWGGGGCTGGGGGGFAMKEIAVTNGETIAVTVGRGGYDNNTATRDGLTSSFGSHVSATGGLSYNTSSNNEGKGVGGDINYNGGRTGSTTQSANAASLLGNGYGPVRNTATGKGYPWNSGFIYPYSAAGTFPESNFFGENFTIDFIGCGAYQSASNGGSANGYPSYPAGGQQSSSNEGGSGLVIVEY